MRERESGGTRVKERIIQHFDLKPYNNKYLMSVAHGLGERIPFFFYFFHPISSFHARVYTVAHLFVRCTLCNILRPVVMSNNQLEKKSILTHFLVNRSDSNCLTVDNVTG